MKHFTENDGKGESITNDVPTDKFSRGDGVLCLQQGMPDDAMLHAIKEAASFGSPFIVVPASSAAKKLNGMDIQAGKRGTYIGDDWRPWAEKILNMVAEVLTSGIPEAYNDYRNPAEGFCFELHGHLPYTDKPLLGTILNNMRTMPEFTKLDTEFRQKYGLSFI